MAKDDFDMDFHFDDDDFDPKAFLDGEDGADIDLSEFDDVPSGGDKLDETVADGYDDELDLSGLGLDEDSDETVDELDLDDILSLSLIHISLLSFFSLLKVQRKKLIGIFFLSIIVSCIGIVGSLVFELVIDNVVSTSSDVTEQNDSCSDVHTDAHSDCLLYTSRCV